MADAVTMVIRLRDQATGPALQAAASISKLTQAARQMDGKVTRG